MRGDTWIRSAWTERRIVCSSNRGSDLCLLVRGVQSKCLRVVRRKARPASEWKDARVVARVADDMVLIWCGFVQKSHDRRWCKVAGAGLGHHRVARA